MVVNRDHNGVAEGKAFFDDGYSLTSLENGQYEYYNFIVSANSIKKHILNERNQVMVGAGITKIIITNAADLAGTDFSCYTTTKSLKRTKLSRVFNPKDNTLTLYVDGGHINSFDVDHIFYGNKS